MSARHIILASSLPISALVVVTSGCYSANVPSLPNIVLHGFSKSNYTALESHLGNQVCVRGKLSIDSMGVYYPLQPVEENDVINLGFSRVKTDMDRAFALQRGFKNGGVQIVCGLLTEATPFKGCDSSECKWYALTAVSQRSE